ncbi:hypothetical protein [Flavobacterium sp. HJSW_4]|uniref:hypothetical protein n=1 Tax=Flavobacterium sp. HJSW_4 TaxID=3344660 RepID=UPI0035F3AEF7
MMYRINTRMANFACIPDAGNMLVNITWHRFDASSGAVCCFTESQMEQFNAFMLANAFNFPQPHYIEALAHDFAFLPSGAAIAKEVPHYLILCKEPSKIEGNKPYARAVLFDENTEAPVAYDLDFEAAGKIEIYRKL